MLYIRASLFTLLFTACLSRQSFERYKKDNVMVQVPAKVREIDTDKSVYNKNNFPTGRLHRGHNFFDTRRYEKLEGTSPREKVRTERKRRALSAVDRWGLEQAMNNRKNIMEAIKCSFGKDCELPTKYKKVLQR